MCHSLVLQPSYAALRYFPGHNGDLSRPVFMAWGKARFLPDFAQYLADELARHPRRKALGCDLITWVRRLSAKPWRN
jgi:hypothetical protein